MALRVAAFGLVGVLAQPTVVGVASGNVRVRTTTKPASAYSQSQFVLGENVLTSTGTYALPGTLGGEAGILRTVAASPDYVGGAAFWADSSPVVLGSSSNTWSPNALDGTYVGWESATIGAPTIYGANPATWTPLPAPEIYGYTGPAFDAPMYGADSATWTPVFDAPIYGADPATWTPLPAPEIYGYTGPAFDVYGANPATWTPLPAPIFDTPIYGAPWTPFPEPWTPPPAPIYGGAVPSFMTGGRCPAGSISNDANTVCCPAQCGTCGGVGCARRGIPSSRDVCCSQIIQAQGPQCSATGAAPCSLVAAWTPPPAAWNPEPMYVMEQPWAMPEQPWAMPEQPWAFESWNPEPAIYAPIMEPWAMEQPWAMPEIYGPVVESWAMEQPWAMPEIYGPVVESWAMEQPWAMPEIYGPVVESWAMEQPWAMPEIYGPVVESWAMEQPWAMPEIYGPVVESWAVEQPWAAPAIYGEPWAATFAESWAEPAIYAGGFMESWSAPAIYAPMQPFPMPMRPAVGCCRAMTANCLACAAGLPVEAFCMGSPGTPGCF